MINYPLLVQHAIFYGLILSGVMSLIIYGTVYYNPEMWLNDYPPDVKAKFGSMSETAKRQGKLVAIPFFFLLIVFLVYSLMELGQMMELTFSAVFLATFLLFSTFNLFDLLILDWLIAVTIQPQFMILPGTEGLAGYKDYGFHFRGFLKGTAGILVFSLVVAAIVAGINAL